MADGNKPLGQNGGSRFFRLGMFWSWRELTLHLDENGRMPHLTWVSLQLLEGRKKPWSTLFLAVSQGWIKFSWRSPQLGYAARAGEVDSLKVDSVKGTAFESDYLFYVLGQVTCWMKKWLFHAPASHASLDKQGCIEEAFWVNSGSTNTMAQKMELKNMANTTESVGCKWMRR